MSDVLTLEKAPVHDDVAIEHLTGKDTFEVFYDDAHQKQQDLKKKKNISIIDPSSTPDTSFETTDTGLSMDEEDALDEDENPNVLVQIDAKDVKIFELVEDAKWVDIYARVQMNPKLAELTIPSFSRAFNSQTRGNLLLHQVCSSRSVPIEILQCVLIANPSAIKTRNQSGCLPLHCACRCGAGLDVIQLLVESHPLAIAEREDTNFALPLHLAACDGAVSSDSLTLLVAAYPEACMIADGQGRKPMHYAKLRREPEDRFTSLMTLEQAKVLLPTARATRARRRTIKRP